MFVLLIIAFLSSSAMIYIAMCCDPRVKGYGKYPKLFNLSEDECSIDAFKIHRKYFVEMQKVSNASMLQSSSLKPNNILSNTSEERSSDGFDEMDLTMVQPRPGISISHSSTDLSSIDGLNMKSTSVR